MRPSRKPRIILVFLITLCGIFVYSYTARLGEKSRVQAAIVDMQARIETAKAEQYKLLDERDELNQPTFSTVLRGFILAWLSRAINSW